MDKLLKSSVNNLIAFSINPDCFDILKTKVEIKNTGNYFSPLFYENQIPIVGFLVIEGQIEIMKKGKIKKIIPSKHLLGVKELLCNKKSNVQAKSVPYSVIGYLDKSTILEILDANCCSKKCQILKTYLKKYLDDEVCVSQQK